jgi:hypothetical protein
MFSTTKSTLLAVGLTIATMLTIGTGAALAAQPHMQTALHELRAARTALEHATNDKGGHRMKALQEVNAAIRETEEGMRFARRH